MTGIDWVSRVAGTVLALAGLIAIGRRIVNRRRAASRLPLPAHLEYTVNT